MPLQMQPRPSRAIVERSARLRMATLRSAARQKRRIFRFQDLPPELRNLIYYYLLHYDGVEYYFERFLNDLAGNAAPIKMVPTAVKMSTPTILLLNKSIFFECIGILRAQPLVLSHGLLSQKLTNIITKPTLRIITHLVFSDHGHPVMDKRFPHTFSGLQSMSFALASILKKGHSLRRLELHFTDATLKWHTDHCWSSSPRCDMRRWTVAIHTAWRKVRGVPEVVIEGFLPESIRDDLITRMHSSINPLMRIPADIRLKIFDMALDWNRASRVLKAYVYMAHVRSPVKLPPMETPTVLLLNRQYTTEALGLLHRKPLHFDFSCSTTTIERLGEKVLHVISPITLQKVRRLSFNIGHWSWFFGLARSLKVLAEKHSLETLHFHFEDCHEIGTIADCTQHYPDLALAGAIFPLSKIRGVGRVTFSGALPECYVQGLIARMESTLELPNAYFEPLHAVYPDGTMQALPEFR